MAEGIFSFVISALFLCGICLIVPVTSAKNTGEESFDGNGNRCKAILYKKSKSKKGRQLEKLQAKNKELERIIYVASHDLRTPLVGIKGFDGILSEDCGKAQQLLKKAKVSGDVRSELESLIDEKIPESLNFILAGASKMQSLLDGLLEVSRIGNVRINKSRLNMNQLVGRVINEMEFQIQQSEATVTVDSLPDCVGDVVQINQVFSNLIDNAVKYLDGERQGVIRISGKTVDQNSIYCVEDNGKGFLPEHREIIFEMFHRLNNGHYGNGEGLGLTIVNLILERHDGKIWVESEPGAGSKFYVLLPGAAKDKFDRR